MDRPRNPQEPDDRGQGEEVSEIHELPEPQPEIVSANIEVIGEMDDAIQEETHSDVTIEIEGREVLQVMVNGFVDRGNGLISMLGGQRPRHLPPDQVGMSLRVTLDDLGPYRILEVLTRISDEDQVAEISDQAQANITAAIEEWNRNQAFIRGETSEE